MKELELLESLAAKAQRQHAPPVDVGQRVLQTLANQPLEPQIIPLIMASLSLATAAAAMFCVVSTWASLQSPWAGYFQSLGILMQ